jgi:hypothetical protein
MNANFSKVATVQSETGDGDIAYINASLCIFGRERELGWSIILASKNISKGDPTIFSRAKNFYCRSPRFMQF